MYTNPKTREEVDMAQTFLIRNFPPDLHRICKMVAGWQGITMTELIFKALEQYLKKYQEVGGLLEATESEETET
jgi:hypothetical protein